jgi:membrane-bound metal-dependent hydrolase YbcI (DUF457 family)
LHARIVVKIRQHCNRKTLVLVLLCHSLLDILAIRGSGLFRRNVGYFLQEKSNETKKDVSRGM